MNDYIFEIKASNIADSNKLLMQLWATLLTEGKIGWQYTPHKQKSTIFVGFLYIHQLSISYEVNFKVKLDNVVQSVIITRQDEKQLTDGEIEYLTKIDLERKLIKKRIFYVQVQFTISSFKGFKYFYPFEYKNMIMYCIDDKQYLDFSIKGFCKEQIFEQVLEIFERISSLLSTQINSTVEIQKVYFVNNLAKLEKNIASIIQDDEDWMDDYPLIDFHFILPEYAKKLLYSIIEQTNSKELNILLRASHHFKHSLMLHQKQMQTELIVAQFMSSVEALAELEIYSKKVCPSCNQKVFSIQKRVLTLLRQEFQEHLVDAFRDFYEIRSRYLHEGKLTQFREYTGISLPQVSTSPKRGCEDYQCMFPMINLIEWIGWFMRKKQKNIAADIID